nr:MAG TPA: TM2 domain [Caudoviricetes sp.]
MGNYRFCTNCGCQVALDVDRCPQCGKILPHVERTTKYCQHCGREIDRNSVFCPECGKRVEPESTAQQTPPVPPQAPPQPSAIYCPRCGVPASPQGYCPKCGNYVGGGQPSAVPVKQLREINKWIAALLCFFLGCMGAHKFYEGKIGMGILYLFTAGLLGIGALVDFIVILTKPDPYYV